MASERERQLLQVARELILEEGMISFRFADIAKRAGVSRVTLYKHFPSKEDVLVSLFVEEAGKSLDMLVDIQNDKLLNDHEKLLVSLLAPVSISMENRNVLGVAFLAANPGIYMYASEDRRNQLIRVSEQLRDINVQFLAGPIGRGTLLEPMTALRDITGKFYPYQRGSVVASQNVLTSANRINLTLETVSKNLMEYSEKLNWNDDNRVVRLDQVYKALGKYERDSMSAC